jgi:hypothetical protein
LRENWLFFWITEADGRYFTGTEKQRGIIYYGLSSNAQRPLAGTLNAAIFNSARRVGAQVLYFLPPLVVAYVAMDWAIERYGSPGQRC